MEIRDALSTLKHDAPTIQQFYQAIETLVRYVETTMEDDGE